MLSKYVGEEKFLKGVSLYLKKRLFGNSITTDLWGGIATATGILSSNCPQTNHDVV
jgi:aminopeptidase 2